MKTNTKNQIVDAVRQGDVLLVARNKQAPKNARPVAREDGRIVLMHGEVTGHAHAVLDRDAAYLETGTADAAERWLRTSDATVLTHEEHSAHTFLPNQDYEQWYQFEYTPQELQRVID